LRDFRIAVPLAQLVGDLESPEGLDLVLATRYRNPGVWS
jgi:hypothetical protein